MSAILLAIASAAMFSAPSGNISAGRIGAIPSAPAAFASTPLDDAALRQVHGTGLLRPSFTRLVVEGGQVGFLRQSAETSRITFDNWWAQTGAALIAENQLAQAGR